jgi:hypothetical protein
VRPVAKQTHSLGACRILATAHDRHAPDIPLQRLAAITWVRHRYMETPPLSAALQVGLGGALVFLTGILIGSSWGGFGGGSPVSRCPSPLHNRY